MDLQRRLLRAMLVMLGLSAAAGVLAVFLSTRVMGRVAGTALVAAVAVALAMPLSRMLDDEKKRVGGMVGLWAIVVSFVLALAAIWVDLASMSWRVEEQLALSAVLACVAGLLAANLLVPRAGLWGRVTRPVALYTVVAGSALFAASIWDKFDSKFGETGWLVVGSGVLIALSLGGMGVEPRPWRWLGVLASAGALVLGLLGVWVIPSNDPSVYITTMGAALVVAYANVVLSVPLGEAKAWACLVSIGSVAATAACVSVLSFMTRGFAETGPDLLNRVTGALGIVAACSTLGVVVLYRLNRRPPGTSAAVSEIRSVHLTCPHCGRKQALAVGEAACEGCGLLISVKVNEPHCMKCDYPLLDLKTDRCPECGTVRHGAGTGTT